MHKKIWIVAVTALITVTSCGDTPLEQGLMGAGAGAATAIVLGGDATTGAVIGGAGNVLYCQQNPSLC
jgi:osmotically inducible lipoprotein OsmB